MNKPQKGYHKFFIFNHNSRIIHEYFHAKIGGKRKNKNIQVVDPDLQNKEIGGGGGTVIQTLR